MAIDRDNSQLYITISYGKPSDGGNGETPPNKQDNDNNGMSKLALYASHELLHILKEQSVKALNSSIGMIGNLTGQHFKQMKVQEAMGQLNKMANIAMGAVAGFQLGGGSPIGAMIGAGSVLIGEAVTWGFNRVNFETSMQKQERDIELLRQRSGLNALLDGSRGTED